MLLNEANAIRSHREYYIGTGKFSVFYTLRSTTVWEGSSHCIDHHIVNLSMNVEEAVSKAAAYFAVIEAQLNKQPSKDLVISFDPIPQEIRSGVRASKDMSRWEIRCMDVIASGVMPFGTHQDTPFCELPDNYIVWLSEQKKEGDGERVLVMNACASIAMGVALERDLFNKRQAEIESHAHVGEVGTRTEIVAKITSVTVNDGKYGDVFKCNMKTPQGDVVIYKGSKFMGEVGDTLTMKANIDYHGATDNGFKYTVIKRPTIIDTVSEEAT